LLPSSTTKLAQVRGARLETLSDSDFAQRIQRTKRICGYGLLNYCGIGTDFLDFTVDCNPYKHGRCTPGMHIPIQPVDPIDATQPDFILILPWNLKQEIVEQMRHVGKWRGKFILPIPEIAVIDPRDAGT
jgi:C-methyltransferase-like protein